MPIKKTNFAKLHELKLKLWNFGFNLNFKELPNHNQLLS